MTEWRNAYNATSTLLAYSRGPRINVSQCLIYSYYCIKKRDEAGGLGKCETTIDVLYHAKKFEFQPRKNKQSLSNYVCALEI